MFSYIFSSEPYSCNQLRCGLFSTPGTPGILSDGSPLSPLKSFICPRARCQTALAPLVHHIPRCLDILFERIYFGVVINELQRIKVASDNDNGLYFRRMLFRQVRDRADDVIRLKSLLFKRSVYQMREPYLSPSGIAPQDRRPSSAGALCSRQILCDGTSVRPSRTSQSHNRASTREAL